MKVLVTCAMKFHSDHLAYQLQKKDALYRVISSFPYFIYAKREPIDRKKFLWLPPVGLVARIVPKIKRSFLIQRWISFLMSRLFDFMVSFLVGSPDVSISWAWSSYYTIKTVQKKGGIAILEECGTFNKYQERLLEEEYRHLGLAYRSTTHNQILEIEQRECEAADYILCPSKYVANSLIEYGIDKGKIIITPYGVDVSAFSKGEKKDDVFRVIFVGGVGVRKGLIYLFQALFQIQLKKFEAVIIGKVDPCFKKIFNQYRKYFIYIPTVPHEKLRYYYSNASVFVLPSLDEGMAYVQLEAMACGLPVICTTHTGGEGVIRDGLDGFIIPIRSSSAIREKIEYFYHNPAELERMANNAVQRANSYTWDNYGDRIAIELNRIIKKGKETIT